MPRENTLRHLSYYQADTAPVMREKKKNYKKHLCFHEWNLIKYERREVGGWGRVPFSKKLMSPTPRRKWYLTTGRRAH